MAKKITKNLKKKIYNSIYNDIVRGKYTIQTILTEKELTEKYEVSKSPVREALIELCNDQVLISIPRKGYQIAQIVPKELYDAIELREIIEISSLRKTIKIINNEILNELNNYIDQTVKIRDEHDALKHWKRNIGFHLLLCSYSDNKWMYDTIKSILSFCTRGAIQFYSKIWAKNNKIFEENVRSHLNLLKAIEDKDYQLAEDLLVEDIYAMKKILF
ncbi:GntR family transcriptional regulator [Iocasia frigidifontis]|uniref:GntR family transcriptional regulator n=1 Tax=Iocasia fonsfrigidae TaxID=2682810 RepID=A0A8A7K8A2_9FIRM|nr:GntR family transcriptional regulator [Iocasia fonsfrigidae]QTL97430.1 GntR family transcriptional regulator [Iocasia fonsfrigidae]